MKHDAETLRNTLYTGPNFMAQSQPMFDAIIAAKVKQRNLWIEQAAKDCLPPAIYRAMKKHGLYAPPFCLYYVAKRMVIWMHPDREEIWYEGRLVSTLAKG